MKRKFPSGASIYQVSIKWNEKEMFRDCMLEAMFECQAFRPGLNVTRIEVISITSRGGTLVHPSWRKARIGCYSPLLPPYSDCGPDKVAETGACGWCGWRLELRRIWSSAFDIVMSLIGRDCSWYREAIFRRESSEPSTSPHKFGSADVRARRTPGSMTLTHT